MYDIRLCEARDFQAILEMGMHFYNSTSYSDIVEMDFDSALELYISMVHNGFILIAEHEGKPVGVIGCLITPFHLNKNVSISTELLWWVEPEHRGGTLAARLLKRAEEESKARGARLKAMSKLTTSPKELGDYYIKRGYREQEATYLKEL